MRIINGAWEFKGRERIKRLVLPGFDGMPISDVLRFVVRGFRRGVLVTRASSIAFNLLMALLPASIFLFTLIPFIPIPNFQEELIKLFESILPLNASHFLETTLRDIVTNKSEGWLIVMFFATIIFSTNGIHAVIHAFVVTTHTFKSRSWIHQRKISVVLLLIVVFMISVAGFLIISGKTGMNKLAEMEIIERDLVIYMILGLKWVIVVLLLLLAISFLYWFAPAVRRGFRFISPGSLLATTLFILSSLGFSAYVNNYGQYNKLYGWIGTLMIILIWLYLNSIALLIGFELNVSIKDAKAQNLNDETDFNSNGETDSF